MNSPWDLFFDPMDDLYWVHQSDVEWFVGDMGRNMERPVEFAERNKWFMPYTRVAEAMVRRDSRIVVALLGALFSWRNCTVDQLRAGLCEEWCPEFTFDEPNLYGALFRLGVINIGFSQSERLYGRRTGQVWLSVGNNAELVRGVLSCIDAGSWVRHMLTRSYRFTAMRQYARHNTLASHVGLSALHDDRVRFCTGDGWGAFKFIDPQASREAGISSGCTTDVVAVTKENVFASVEVQASSVTLDKKVENWARLLTYSPMSRRGILCIWLFIPNSPTGAYSSYMPPLERSRLLPEMQAGNPTVAERMGYAQWDDWFDHGIPTGRFGSYTDMNGNQGSMFDPKWVRVTPPINTLDSVKNWGWWLMRQEIWRQFGWDIESWAKPDAYRGGFYGFSTNVGERPGKERAR